MKKLCLIALSIANVLIVGMAHAYETTEESALIPADVEQQIELIDMGDVNCGVDTEWKSIKGDTSK